MRDRLARLWAHHKIALIAFVLAIFSLGYFGAKSLSATLYWMDPAHQNQPVAGWMTPRYVARSYKLPPEVIGPALFLVKGETPRRISLDAIAAEHGLSLEEIQARIDDAADAWRAAQDQ